FMHQTEAYFYPIGEISGLDPRGTDSVRTRAYRWYLRALSLQSLGRSVLKLASIVPLQESLFGIVEQASDVHCQSRVEHIRSRELRPNRADPIKLLESIS
ncbi:MAG: hypothetical protein EA417_17490, partial [Gammaproteobacteria bacterium]